VRRNHESESESDGANVYMCLIPICVSAKSMLTGRFKTLHFIA